MGRNKTFDEEKTLQLVMFTFWRNGYSATTYSALENATGLTGRSLINAFGDKDEIFHKSLIKYTDYTHNHLCQIFSTPGVDAIIDMFEDFKHAEKDDPRHAGCLIINTIFEGDKITEEAQDVIQNFRKMLYDFFVRSFRADHIDDLHGKSEFLINILWGIGTEIRLSGSIQSVQSVLNYVIEMLRLWKKSSSV